MTFLPLKPSIKKFRVCYSTGIFWWELGGFVPRNIKEVELTSTDSENVLCHILETISVYEYPTPSVFSALTRLGIVSYLRGRGVQKDIEVIAIDVFRQLTEMAQENSKYTWFTDWSRKLVETVKEKKVEKE